MQVLRYTLENGAEVEITVASDQIREAQVTAHIVAGRPPCHVKAAVSQFYLGVW